LGAGFNIIIPDVKYNGERAYQLGFRDISTFPPFQSLEDSNIFLEMMTSTVKEIRLIMDYIETDVYPGEAVKFNLIGYSLGGGISLLLNSIEDRINSVAACVPPMGLPYSQMTGVEWEAKLNPDPKTLSPLYSATNQKSPVALILGEQDPFLPAEEAKEFFEHISIDEKVIKFHQSGHELPDEYIDDVISWMLKNNEM